jgi:formate dehydrogenase subunit beta
VNEQWSIETHGDPIGLVRCLLCEIWQQQDLAGMLVTMDTDNSSKAIPRFIADPAFVDEINPFRPLMEVNTARLIPELLEGHTHEHIAAILRPCEMRALTEMKKHANINTSGLLTISFDCLGTLPVDEYQWRLERLEKMHPAKDPSLVELGDDLAGEALRFARQGGIVPYRYRPACQVCITPAADQADVNVSVLGLPIRQRLLVSVPRPEGAQGINLSSFTAQPADQRLLSEHNRVVSRLCERHDQTMERINQALGSLLPQDLDALITRLENCGDCQSCLDVCPICSVDRPFRDMDGHYERESVMRWLVSCSGCGMCQQACPSQLPVFSIFAHIRQQLDQENQYQSL